MTCDLYFSPAALIRCIDFRGIDETNRSHLRFETRHTLSSMSHKPNFLSWDQDVAASPREFHETDSSHLAVVFFSSYQVFETFILPKIIANYSFLFFKCFVIRARQKKFPDLRKLSSFAKITNTNIARHFENH